MKYERVIERDAQGGILSITESVICESDDERCEWWETATIPIIKPLPDRDITSVVVKYSYIYQMPTETSEG